MPEDSEDAKKIEIESPNLFVSSSILLFLDSLVVSVSGWVYWLVISKLALASEIGAAVTLYSIVILVTTLTQLGFEYPLLKKSNIRGSRILGTSLLIELILTLASIPFVLFLINIGYSESVKQFTWISIPLLILFSLEFIIRFGLYGISKVRTVLIIDIIGLAIKLPTGFLLVGMSFGSLGILLAYLFEVLFVFFALLYFIKISTSFRLGSTEYFKETIKDALINTPAKWSKVIIVSLTVVLLAPMNVDSSDIGIFYVALMITIVVASFATSMAYMVIPSSSSLKTDLSSSSLRISLSVTAPIVVVLLLVPESVLSLIGAEYVSAGQVLLVLAMSIIPSAITINSISMLNNLGRSKMLILTGIVQIATFLTCFFIFVPLYGILGAAISILIAYLSSSLLFLALMDRRSHKYIASACISVLGGFIMGHVAGLITSYEYQLIVIASSIIISLAIIFLSKNMTIKETKFLLKTVIKRR